MVPTLLAIVSTTLAIWMLLTTILNAVTIRRLKNLDPNLITNNVSARVSILIPMRNEALNAKASAESALAQRLLGNFEVLVRNDQSNDDTGLILNRIKDSRLSIQSGDELPAGWLGKNYALDRLVAAATGDYLVFLDADVRLEKSAIASSIALMESLQLDYISPYPKQLVNDLGSGMVQPLLQWSWFATLPVRLTERSLRGSTVVANGQFFIVRRDAYLACGGHAKIKNEVIEDIELARLLRGSGYFGTVVDGSRIATCLMYQNFFDLLNGYSKSQWRAFGNPFQTLSVVALLFISSIYPAIIATQGEIWALWSYLALVCSRFITAQKTDSVRWSSLFHPISALIWISLIFRSWNLKRLGKLNWRGRML